MNRLILFLLALCALPLKSAVTVASLAVNTATGAVTYSTVLLTMSSSGFYDHWRVKVNTSSCAGGAGTIQPMFPGTSPPFNVGYNILVGGLTKNTHYFLCVELSDDGGSVYSTGAAGEIQVTTSAVEENEPRPIKRFNSDYPNTGDFATMPTCPSVNAQNYCRTAIPFGTTDIRSYFDTAIAAQCSHGTILTFAHSNTPVLFTQNTYSSVFAACGALQYAAANITGNVIDFGGAHGLTEGDVLTVGQGGFRTYPTSNSCYGGMGWYNGRTFLAHVVSSTAISLICGDGTNNPVVISSPGSAANGLFFMPHVRTQGTCPTVNGREPCEYWDARGMYEVILRSDADDSLLPPPGSRLTPAYCASGLCSIWVNPVANVQSSSSTAIFFPFGNNDGNVGIMISKIRLGPGIQTNNEIDASQRSYCNMVSTSGFGSGNTVDRVYMHGGDTTPPVLQRWGGPSCPAAKWEGYNTSVQDSTLDNIREWHVSNGTSGSSMVISEGPGPVHFVNNWIEGAGAPVLHSDGDGGSGKIYGNESILRNTFYAPTFMMHGAPDSDGHFSGFRQLFEAKAGWGIELAGNIWGPDWVEENPTSGFAVFTSVSGPPPEQGIGVTDVNIFSNTFRHGPGGVGMPIVVYGHRVTIAPARFAFKNNLLYDIDSKWTATGIATSGAKGWWYQGPGSGEGAITDHNTWVGNTNAQAVAWLPVISRFQNTPFAGWSFTNNFTYQFGVDGTGFNSWGISAEGGIDPGPCIGLTGEAFANACLTPSYVWKNNVMMAPGVTASQIATNWPARITDNYNPTNMSLSVTPGWTKYDSSGDTGNYRLLSTSNYRSGAAKTLTTGPASDGADVGVDMTKLLNDQGHVTFASVSPIGTTTASVNFTAPDNQSCPVRVTATAPWIGSSVPTGGVQEFPDSGTAAGARAVALTGLTPGTLYYFKIECSVEQPASQFRTR